MTTIALYNRCLNVISGLKSKEQLMAATNYVKFAFEQSNKPKFQLYFFVLSLDLNKYDRWNPKNRYGISKTDEILSLGLNHWGE